MTETNGGMDTFKDWPKPPAPGSFDGFIYVETGDVALDAARRLVIFGALGTIPQRVVVGVDPQVDSDAR